MADAKHPLVGGTGSRLRPITFTSAANATWTGNGNTDLRQTTGVTLNKGATSTDCKKPSCRSSIMEMVEKIAVNKTISAIVPGKKY